MNKHETSIGHRQSGPQASERTNQKTRNVVGPALGQRPDRVAVAMALGAVSIPIIVTVLAGPGWALIALVLFLALMLCVGVIDEWVRGRNRPIN